MVYERVADPEGFYPLLVGLSIHSAVSVMQLVVAAYLAVSGLYRLFYPEKLQAASWTPTARKTAALVRLLAGVLLVSPLLLGAPWPLSLGALFGALAVIALVERPTLEVLGRFGQWNRRLVLALGGLVGAFGLFEFADPAAQTRFIFANMSEWGGHEGRWQRENDVRSPKVGDLAPDFALQDASGTQTVKLSSFRGERPVALVFGSYT
ncbi:MAG: hypothetical protein AAGK22_10010 [Acidobacteriota bacterium]